MITFFSSAFTLTDMSAASVDLMDLQANEGIIEESHAPQMTTFPLPSRISHPEGTSSDPDLMASMAVTADKKTIADVSPESSISQEELDEGDEEEEAEDDDLLEVIPESPKSVDAPETRISSGRIPAFERISEEERGLSSDSASSKGLRDESSTSKPSSASSNDQRTHSPLTRVAGTRPSLHRMTAVEESKIVKLEETAVVKTEIPKTESPVKEVEEKEIDEDEEIVAKDPSIPRQPLVDPRFDDVEDQEKARIREGMQTILQTFAKEAVIVAPEPPPPAKAEPKLETKVEMHQQVRHDKQPKTQKHTMWTLGQISPSKVKPLLPTKPNPERLLPIGPSPRDVISPKPVCFKSYTITKESRKSPGPPTKPTDLPVPSFERLLPIGPSRDRSKSPHSGSIKRLPSPEPTFIQMPLQSSSPMPSSVFLDPLPTDLPPPKPPRLHQSKEREKRDTSEQRHQPKLSEVVIPIDSEPEILSLSIMMEKSLENPPEETSLPPVCKVTAKILEKVPRPVTVVSTPVTEAVVTVVTSSSSMVSSSPSVAVTVTTATPFVPIVVAKTATVVTQASSQAVTVTLPSSGAKEASISFPSSMRESMDGKTIGVKAQVVLASSESLEDKLGVSSKVLSSKKDKKKKAKKKPSQQQQLENKESSSSTSSKEKTVSSAPSKKRDVQESSPTSSVKEREKREGVKTTVSSSGSSPAKSSSSFAVKNKKKKESKSETQTPTESVKESVRRLREGMTTSSSLGMISGEIINQTAEGSAETQTTGGNIISKIPMKTTMMASYSKNGQVSSSTSAVDESGRPGTGRQYKQRRQRKTGGMNFMESQRSLDNKTTCGTTGGVAAGVQRRARKTESTASAASKRSSVSQASLTGESAGQTARVGDSNAAGGATSSMSYYHDDGAIHERCSKCNHVMEEFSEEEIGMCIIILRTYVHRESALAAPILPEMLKLVSRFASYFPYAWQTER